MWQRDVRYGWLGSSNYKQGTLVFSPLILLVGKDIMPYTSSNINLVFAAGVRVCACVCVWLRGGANTRKIKNKSIGHCYKLPSLCLIFSKYDINGLVQDCSNSVANALELLQYCIVAIGMYLHLCNPSELKYHQCRRRFYKWFRIEGKELPIVHLQHHTLDVDGLTM